MKVLSIEEIVFAKEQRYQYLIHQDTMPRRSLYDLPHTPLVHWRSLALCSQAFLLGLPSGPGLRSRPGRIIIVLVGLWSPVCRSSRSRAIDMEVKIYSLESLDSS